MSRDDDRLRDLADRFLVDEPPPPIANKPRVSIRRTFDRSVGRWKDSKADIRAEIAHLERAAATDFTAGAICALRWVLGEGDAPCNA